MFFVLLGDYKVLRSIDISTRESATQSALVSFLTRTFVSGIICFQKVRVVRRWVVRIKDRRASNRLKKCRIGKLIISLLKGSQGPQCTPYLSICGNDEN